MAVTHEDIPLLTQMPTNSEVRPKPSPAFNAETKEHVQPLVGRKNDMDESFIGKTGGEIFHEMMLRHDVKHICKAPFHTASR
jgi:acetolactate synthase-1/2/3 large subunit